MRIWNLIAAGVLLLAAPGRCWSAPGVKAIAAGAGYSLALVGDGTVWQWGSPTPAGPGQLSYTGGVRSRPVPISGLSGIVGLAAGRYGLAVTNGGTVWQWGGWTLSAPWLVTGLRDVTAVAAGSEHSMALESDGTVWAWGYNEHGELGDGTWNATTIPVQARELSGVTAIAGGFAHSLALKRDGSVWAWGHNGYGQLGDGSVNRDPQRPGRNTPAQVSGLSGVIGVAGGFSHSLAVKDDGTVWAWGGNGSGQLGDGTTTNRTEPVQVIGLSGVAAVSAGGDYSLAVKRDGTVWAWGFNGDGQLGDGTTADRLTPVQVNGLTAAAAVAAGSRVYTYLPTGMVACHGAHALAIRNDGSLWAWGSNDSFQLGDGTPEWRSTPVQAVGLSDITSIAAGAAYSMALKRDGTVWTWGWSLSRGGLGKMSPAPESMIGVGPASAVAAGDYHAAVVGPGGAVWEWGYTWSDGSEWPQATPTATTGIEGVTAIAASAVHTMALKSDGTVWIWGAEWNPDGSARPATPVRVNGLSRIVALAGGWDEGYGFNHYLALRDDKTVWEWGVEAPHPIAGLAGVVAIAAGFAGMGVPYVDSLALRDDGTVWGWDSTGLSATPSFDPTRPAAIRGLTNIVAIAAGATHCLAVRGDGTVWAWGSNYEGQLGDGTTEYRDAPVQVTMLTGVQSVAAGVAHSLALKRDGTVWAWGNNEYGQLGDGRTIMRTTPAPVIQPWVSATIQP